MSDFSPDGQFESVPPAPQPIQPLPSGQFDPQAPPVQVVYQPVTMRPTPLQSGIWFWPLMVLLSLAALGGGIGLVLHEVRAETRVETGQCFTNLASIPGNNVASLLHHRVPCQTPHEGEIVAVIDPPSGMREEEIGTWPDETCGFRFEDYVGLPATESELTLRAFPLFTTANDVAGEDGLRDALNSGHWKLVCMVVTDGTTTGSVRHARR